MRKLFISIFLVQIICVNAQPYQNKNLNSAEIKLRLGHLSTLGNVLYIAAHPDDENTRFLAYCALERGYQTSYLSLTRGDGGQNLIGNEQGIELGLIRTQELLAARSVDGAHQYFTRAYDFGFSKNPEETFTKWDKNSLLGDVVWVIRKLKPDVIVTRFSPEPGPTHGHHTASAILALEAFKAAADSQSFPEQLKWVETHQAKRIFWNTSWFFFGTKDYDKTGLLSLDVGKYNSLLGKSYGEIAAESRSMHSSQGFGSARQRGEELEYFKFLGGTSASNDLFDGITTNWSRLGKYDDVQSFILKLNQEFNPQQPQNSVKGLIQLFQWLQKKPANIFINQKLSDIKDLIIQCAGFYVDVAIDKEKYWEGDEVTGKMEVIVRSETPVQVQTIQVLGHKQEVLKDLKNNELMSIPIRIATQMDHFDSSPFWLKNNIEKDFFQLQDLKQIGPASNFDLDSNQYMARIQILINKEFQIEITKPIVFKKVIPETGEVYSTPQILPSVIIHPSAELMIFKGNESKIINVAVKGRKGQNGRLKINTSEGWNTDKIEVDFVIPESGEFTSSILVSAGKNAKSGEVVFSAEVDGNIFHSDLHEIRYNHIPPQFYFSPSVCKLQKVNAVTVKRTIGYFEGAGDNVAKVLSDLGYYVKSLKESEIAEGNLAGYDAIVMGVRAYNTKESLKSLQKVLLEYVKTGGTLILQYNTSRETVTDELGPYPLKLGRDRVTVEEAPVTILKPDHPLMNYPNKIQPEDFQGWVQERGLYFVSEWDERYESLFEMADPGEKASKGSLLFAKYGKGTYIYTGLSFFRQLPAGNEGALKLFVNLIESKQ